MSGLLTLALLTTTWILVTLGSQKYADDQFQSILTTVSKELLDEMEPEESLEDDFAEMVEEINEAAAQTSERLVVLHVRGEQVLGRSHPDGPVWPGQGDRDWKLLVLPFRQDQLVAAIYFGDEQNDLNRQSILLGLICLLVFFLTLAGSWHLVGAALAPIGLLALQAQDAKSHSETRLVSPSNDVEITDLVATLNQFLDRLAESSEARSRFYASASHELRTPLQALSGHLELALNKERDAEDYREALMEAKAQSQRLIRLTQDLLALNRLEVGAPLASETLDLADYCEIEWGQLKVKAKQKALVVSLLLPETAQISAPPSYLAIVCRNLFENAVKYCKVGGKLEIRLEPESGQLKLSVYNDCDPIDSAAFEKLREPFFLPDPSRHSLSGGNGLGLAIVNSVVSIQSWRLELSQVENGFLAEVLFKKPPSGE